MENSAIVVVIVILALVAVFAYFAFLKGSPQQSAPPAGKSQNSSAPPTQNSSYPAQNAASQGGNNYSTAKSPNCLSNMSYVWVGNFSTGSYFGWNTTGSGFGATPLNITFANQNGIYYGSPWSNYNHYGSEYFATTYSQSRPIRPGILSSSFVVVEPYLNFQIISPANPQIYMEISYNGKPEVIEHYNTSSMGYNMSTFDGESINMSSLLCKSVTLSIVANVSAVTSSDQNQFVAVANFYQSPTP